MQADMHACAQTDKRRLFYLFIYLFFEIFDIAKFANPTNLKTDMKVTIYREKLKPMRT